MCSWRLVVVLGFWLCGVCSAQTVNIGSSAASYSIPSSGEWVCTYYRPIAKHRRHFQTVGPQACWGGSTPPGDYHHWIPAGAALTGEAARAMMPVYWYTLAASGSGEPEYYASVHAFAAGAGSIPTGADSGTRSYMTMYMSQGAPAFRGGNAGHGVHIANRLQMHTHASGVFGNDWPAHAAGSNGETCDLAIHRPAFPLGPLPTSTSFEVWISPRFFVGSTTGTRGWTSASEWVSDPVEEEKFLWVRYEWRALSMFSGGGSGCCPEVVERLTTISNYLAYFWSDWTEEFLPRWISQDNFIRSTLAQIVQAVVSPPSPPPAGSAQAEAFESLPSGESIGTGVRSALSEFPVQVPSLGISSDAERPPTWTFVVPANPLAAGSPNHYLSFSAADYTWFEPVLLVINACWYVWATLWAMSVIWEETRKYG